jgi:hypothetical protein
LSLIIYSPKSYGERRLLLCILIVSGLILLSIAIFYALNPRPVIGDALVNTAKGTPEEWPSSNLSPFYVKPVTIMFVAAIGFSYCLFSLVMVSLVGVPRALRAFLLVASVLTLGVSCYETLFNFILWGSLLANHLDPDLVVNSYPVSSVRVNLVFATKSFVALLFVSYFSLTSFKYSLDSEKP